MADRDGVPAMEFSTGEVAQFMGRSVAWVHWGLRENVFSTADGEPVRPARVGAHAGGGRRRFTPDDLREIAGSAYRRRIFDKSHLDLVLGRVRAAEEGREWRREEGWRQVVMAAGRRKWVPPAPGTAVPPL